MILINRHTPESAGAYTAKITADYLNKCIANQGYARIALSTGASQFPFFESIIKEGVDWSKVEMFHLDEYVGINESHKASFKKYLMERFVSRVNLKAAHFVDGLGNPDEVIAHLTQEINRLPVDIGLIGIGENSHIAFNDPPADFDNEASYKVVDLNDDCKQQQVREGWFESEKDVCKQAISMTCKQIMRCKKIICLVPYAVKAQAIKQTVESPLSPFVPSSLLKQHNDVTIVCDDESCSLVDKKLFDRCENDGLLAVAL